MNEHAADGDALLAMRDIGKSFPGVRALDDVTLVIKRGEIVGLLGENGAGKSTLMKILTGVYHPDEGTIIYDGESYAPKDPSEAYTSGISMIFQELNNCSNLTALENLFLGRERRIPGTPFLDYRRMRKAARGLFDRLHLDIDPDVPMARLSVAHQQMVEIAKSLSYDVKLLVMDEPTSSLSDNEITQLYSIIAELRDQGISVIFISHKLNEVLAVTDRVVVLRDGQNAGEIDSKAASQESLISMMVGRELGHLYTERRNKPGKDTVLMVRSLSGPPDVEDINFELKKGEILGFAGLVGAGRTEMAKLLIGAVRKREGEVELNGEQVHIGSPVDAVRNGIAYLPEDRKTLALVLPMSVRENLTMSIHPAISRLLNVIDRRREREVCDRYVKDLSIKVSDTEYAVQNLSGGNQQKVVIAKWLATEPQVLILDEPTRGIDVGAKAEVHRIIADLADSGVSIMLISSELPEILALSDRVLVMHEGRQKAVLAREDANQESILSAALTSAD